MSSARRLTVLAALTLATGCALTQRSSPLEVTYYTPEHVRPSLTSAQPARGPLLHLGQVSSGVGLGERIAFREGEYQVGYYDNRRWTERPTVYVRRALTRRLFEEGNFDRALSGSAPKLEVDVLTFEEVKTRPQHTARIALRAVLSTDRVLLEDTVAATEPVAGDGFDAVVAATAGALDEATDEIARRVRAKLSPPGVTGSQ